MLHKPRLQSDQPLWVRQTQTPGRAEMPRSVTSLNRAWMTKERRRRIHTYIMAGEQTDHTCQGLFQPPWGSLSWGLWSRPSGKTWGPGCRHLSSQTRQGPQTDHLLWRLKTILNLFRVYTEKTLRIHCITIHCLNLPGCFQSLKISRVISDEAFEAGELGHGPVKPSGFSLFPLLKHLLYVMSAFERQTKQ